MKNIFIHESSIVGDKVEIGAHSKIWHFCHIMTDVSIGKNCNIGQNVFVGSGVSIGSNVKIQNNVSLYKGVTIEDDVFLGPGVIFTNVNNPRSQINRKEEFMPTLVRKGATIGANATVLCGIEIGSYAFVGAGAVVTKNVIPYQVIVGNPAIQIGWMSEYGEKLVFDESNVVMCSLSGQKYRMLPSGKVVKF